MSEPRPPVPPPSPVDDAAPRAEPRESLAGEVTVTLDTGRSARLPAEHTEMTTPPFEGVGFLESEVTETTARCVTPPFGSPAFEFTPPASTRETPPPFGTRETTPPFGKRETTPPFGTRETTPPFGTRETTPPFGSTAGAFSAPEPSPEPLDRALAPAPPAPVGPPMPTPRFGSRTFEPRAGDALPESPPTGLSAASPAPPPAVSPEPVHSPARVREPLDFTLITRALALLFAEALALGLGVWQLALGDQLLTFVTKNQLDATLRRAMLATGAGTGLLLVLVFSVLFLWQRGPRPRRIYDLAVRLSPLLLVAMVPPLLIWKAWKSDDLSFLLLVVLVGLGGRGLFEASLRAPPIFTRPFWGRLAFRWPAALRRHAPLGIVLLGVLGYVVFFSFHTISYHRNLHSNSFDLGLENNLLWNLWDGSAQPFKTSPMFGPTGTHFGHHATAIAYVLTPIYALWQEPEMLLLMQTLFMGGAAIPLFLFARRHLSGPTAAAITVCYLLFPPLHGANLYDFHYLSLGPFFVWWTLFLADSGRIKSAFVMGFLTLAVREDVAASLGVVGLYLLFSGHKPKAGLVMALAGGGYFVAMKLFIMPLIATKQTFTYMFKDLIPAGDKGFGGVLKTVLGNPVFALDSIVDKKKFVYGLQFLAPLLFLPLRRPVGLFLFLPAFFFTLLSTGYAPLIQTSFQYTAHWTGPLFVGVVLHLAWMERQPAEPGLGVVSRRAAVGAMCLATVLCSYQFGAIFQQNTARGGFEAYSFGTSDKEIERHDQLYALLERIPADAKVAAGEKLLPHVSSRPDAYTLRIGLFDAKLILVEPAAETGDSKKKLRDVLDKKSFGIIASEGPFYLLEKGAATERNVEIDKLVGRKAGK